MRKTFTLLFLLFASQLFSQSISLSDRIKAVENNLIPFVPVKGFKGWNILDRMKYYKVPGVSIAVIKNYQIDWAKGYGFADTVLKKSVDNETMFSAGSISKLVMAVAALKLVEKGKIDLDKPINEYLTSWKVKENSFTIKTPISLRMLLSHSAGTSQSSYFGFLPNQKLPSILEILNGEKIAETRGVIVNSEPQKEFHYSGGGSMIAQLALMDVTQKSFEVLTQEMIFDQLRMKHSTFEQPLPKKFSNKTAWAYSTASWFKGMPYVYPQQAAAGLYSTPTDLANFFIDIQKSYKGKGKILDSSTTRKMLKPQYLVSDGSYKEQIGIGPFLMQRTDNQDSNAVYFEFTGVNAGFLAYGIAGVSNGNGVVIMLNSGDDVNGFGKELRRSVAKVYNWPNFLPEEISPVQLPESNLNQFVGRYRMSADEVLYLRKEKNYLVENINEGNNIYCFPISKDTIVFSDYNIKGYFIRNEKGEVIGLQNIYQSNPMLKMRDDEFSPSEYLNRKNFSKAKNAFADMKLNDYQISYIAYNLLNKNPLELEAVKTILEVAIEQHPNSSIVHSRWGDYFLKKKNKATAIQFFQKAIELDPNNMQAKEILDSLK